MPQRPLTLAQAPTPTLTPMEAVAVIERAIVGASSIPPSPALGPAGAPPNVEPAAVDTGLLKLPSKLPNEVRFNPTNLCHSPNWNLLN